MLPRPPGVKSKPGRLRPPRRPLPRPPHRVLPPHSLAPASPTPRLLPLSLSSARAPHAGRGSPGFRRPALYRATRSTRASPSVPTVEPSFSPHGPPSAAPAQKARQTHTSDRLPDASAGSPHGPCKSPPAFPESAPVPLGFPASGNGATAHTAAQARRSFSSHTRAPPDPAARTRRPRPDNTGPSVSPEPSSFAIPPTTATSGKATTLFRPDR